MIKYLLNDFSYIIFRYLTSTRQEIKFPLKYLQRKNLGPLEKLGFAYASIFTSFLGNVTSSKFRTVKNPHYKYFIAYFTRWFYLRSPPYKLHNYAISASNEFGRLHFVSCGSRGIEPFPFIQFFSVFEWKVWVAILVAITIFSVSINKLTNVGRKSVGFLSGMLCMYKLLLEQGDPFPSNICKNNRLKLLVGGTLLVGCVISNGFKSENVYKIVRPRFQVSYYNIDEFIEDNVTVYVPITTFDYYYGRDVLCKKSKTVTHYFGICKHTGLGVYGRSVLYDQVIGGLSSPDLIKYEQYSQTHPLAIKALLEPLNYFADMFAVGVLNNKSAKLIGTGKTLEKRFFKIQNDLVRRSLNNCSKIAWVLPNYLAHISHRLLKVSGKHSDVSNQAFTFPVVTFEYIRGYVPSSILQRISWMPTNGLLEWWPKMINRSDIVLGSSNVPIKPNMSGNILIVFMFLCGGLSIAISTMIIEMWRHIWFNAKIVHKCCVRNLKQLIFRNDRVNDIVVLQNT